MIVCRWSHNTTCILHLNEVDVLFYIELREENDRSVDDIIRYRLGEVMTDVGLSFQMLKQIIMRLKVLFILDGQDEACQNDLLRGSCGKYMHTYILTYLLKRYLISWLSRSKFGEVTHVLLPPIWRVFIPPEAKTRGSNEFNSIRFIKFIWR